MSLPPIPPRVLKFLAEKIDTVIELEALLIMSDDENRAWTEQEVAARLYTQPASAARVLDALSRRQLIAAEGKPPQYRFNQPHSDDRTLIAEVAQAYSRNVVAISTYIHSKASVSVKEFARAFDLKKEP